MELDLSRPPPPPKTLAEAYELIVALWAEIARLREENTTLRARVTQLQERLRTNSSNSSMPPSSDGPGVAAASPTKPPSARRHGGQPGHPGHARALAVADCVVACDPPAVCPCGGAIRREAEPAWRHPVSELPPMRPVVTEYRVFDGTCENCGKVHRGALPAGVPTGCLGPRALATIGTLSGRYHLSRRNVVGVLADLGGLTVSLGTVSQSEALVSAAVASPVAEARDFVQTQPAVHADETGQKMAGKRAWVWVAVAGAVAVFVAGVRRTSAVAQSMLGEAFAGVLVSDRFAGYAWVRTALRQLCWAHLIRDFVKMEERGGRSAEIASELLLQAHWLFHWWHRERDGPAGREGLWKRLRLLRWRVEELLAEGAVCGEAKTERTCRRLWKLKAALWTFLRVAGVEPTNNEAERTIRKWVLWRQGSFGTQGERGNRYMERVLTVSETCRRQGRGVLEYLTAAITARFSGAPAPSLLPVAA